MEDKESEKTLCTMSRPGPSLCSDTGHNGLGNYWWL